MMCNVQEQVLMDIGRPCPSAEAALQRQEERGQLPARTERGEANPQEGISL